eukprot:TRINITY_DN1170_c1_g1_i1.p1 TRINITY_DN1170_c1_g1~~TRINITY_DN1170_c1_g1_i1.p1  ORF type:complete len:240 (+),score=34.90 TRINITY_DN1170_c1_g1_i1:81-722(+)
MATSRPYRAPTPPPAGLRTGSQAPSGGMREKIMGGAAPAERINLCRITVLVVGSLVLFMLFHMLAKVSPETLLTQSPTRVPTPAPLTAAPDMVNPEIALESKAAAKSIGDPDSKDGVLEPRRNGDLSTDPEQHTEKHEGDVSVERLKPLDTDPQQNHEQANHEQGADHEREQNTNHEQGANAMQETEVRHISEAKPETAGQDTVQVTPVPPAP